MLCLNYCESVYYGEIKIFLKNYEKNHLKNLGKCHYLCVVVTKLLQNKPEHKLQLLQL